MLLLRYLKLGGRMSKPHVLDQKELIEKRNWDVLIILDACRYDIFNMLYGSKFNVIPVKSRGSCTVEWFYYTFTKKYKDVVYISGNPYISSYVTRVGKIRFRASDIFARVINVWNVGWTKINEVYTVNPSTIYHTSIVSSKFHKDKKFIIHFLQPHAPYPMCDKLRKYFTSYVFSPDFNLWKALEKGEIKPDIVKECYIKNLEWVMNFVFRLLQFFEGRRIVITGDHGECFGEKGYVDHPCGVDILELRIVPWVYLYPTT